MSRCFLRALAVLFAAVGLADGATLIPFNSSWKYLKGTVEASSPTNAWRTTGFNDTAWAGGTAPFYYGETLSGTLLSDMQGVYSCLFIRKNFNIADPAGLVALKLDVQIDDGFIAWINGTEVFRYNMPGGEPARTNLATAAIEPELQSRTLTNLASLLVAGQNVLTLQGFNSSLAGSSDFVLDAALAGFVPDNTVPTIGNVSPAPGQLNALTQITVTFSEPVIGVQANHLLVNGNSAAGVSGQDAVYTFTFAEPPYGPVQISWFDQHTIQDLAFVPHRFDHAAPGSSWQYDLIDQTPPTIAGLFPAAGATVRSLSQIEVTFSEDVVGVDASDLLMNNQPATNVFNTGGGPYVFQFAPPANGLVQLSWVASPGIADLALPANAFVPAGWSYQLDPNATAGDLVITEILAANQSGLADEDGQQEDWIEIYNRGSGTVNLAGWSLSDDADEPGRWIFPARSLAPGAYLVVFASGKDRKNPAPANRFHTSFRLANGGEFLGLYSPDSPRTLISGFAPGFPEQRNDHSFGYDSQGALRYFSVPTPGGPNGTSTILALTDPVHFSVERGFYSNSFDLHLSTPTIAGTVRYTLDGSEPTVTLGTVYTGPLRITNSAMVRAVAYRHNFLPSTVRTHTYLFNQSAAIRSLPVISIVTANSNLTGPSGILGVSNVILTTGANPYYVPMTNNGVRIGYHNPSEHGIAWERPASAELINPQDNSGFQIDCGLRVQGSDWQRPRIPNEAWKFSLRLYFRGDYGEDRLEYPWFPTTHVVSHDQVVLRAGYNDPDNPFIRDEMGRRLSGAMGQVAAQGTLGIIFLNGATRAPRTIYYNPCQRVHEEMLQEYHGGSGEWDVVGPSFATGAEELGVIDGDRTDFVSMVNYIWTQTDANIRVPAIYTEAARRLDMANFADYLILNGYSYMGDWPANNWRAGRDRAGGIWRFYLWDAEWGLGFNGRAIGGNSFTDADGLGNTGGSEIARLFQKLRQNPEHRLLWADRIHKHMFNGGALTDSNILRQFNILRDEMRGVLPGMDAQIANSWIPQRRPIFLSQCLTLGLLASSNAPGFSQHGGRVALGYLLTMTNIAGQIYFTTNGTDPRIPFTAAVAGSASQYSAPISIGQTMVVKARSLNGTNWSAVTEAEFQVESLILPLRITELMYNPIGGSAFEFIELENYGATSLDLSGLNFSGITFSFPDPTILAPGARFLLASDANPGGFAARYPGVTVNGLFGGQLNNGGETIVLRDPAGKTILSISFDNGGLWPAAADGAGYSLVFINGDPDDPLNWRASGAQGGTPGATENFPSNPPNIVISEINAATAPQWIELHNQTGSAINLAGYSLTDDTDARKFVLPSLTIASGQYLIVYATNFFNLNPRGDEVLLYNPQTNLISRVSFGLQAAGYTLSLINGDWVLGNSTPNAANTAATVNFVTNLIINEWMANPPTSEDDWIELWNNGPQPISLEGLYLGTSNGLFRITSRSYIAPFGFTQLFADEDAGPDHLDFRLPAPGGWIALYDRAGVEVSRVDYGAQAENVSQGRLPNGSANIQTFPGSGSPGASNYVITYSGPYLNEVMARNVSTLTNALGRVPDWIEIYNPGGAAVDLAGMSLSVDGPAAFQWIFPPSSLIPPSGFLVVWCDGDLPASTAFSANMNCGQSLNGDSGGVYLFNTAGQLVNFVEYGFQLANQSIGRIGASWRLQDTFTAGAANSAAASLGAVNTLVFNEWMADPARGDDWFELYNPAALPVELGGLALTDDPSLGGQGKFRIAPLSFIGPKGWVRFEADGNPGSGFHHVNFSLDAGGESLRLYNTVNVTNFIPITSVYFGPQALDISEGRLPDGAASIVRFPGSPTPAASNHQLPGSVVINEVLAATDAIELYNSSAASANVGGWFLSNTSVDYKLYRIPDGTSISAGGYLVVTPTGFDLNPALGGEVILSAADTAGNLNGQRIHASFGPQAAGVSFGRFSTSQGIAFVALATPTLSAANSPARVGPIVINEILYNPAGADSEFIELHNISTSDQSLAGWTLANAVRVNLPAVSLPPGDFAVIQILPEHGRLDNAGERIDLLMPGGILVDSVDYRDSTPWPSGQVDGGGLSLQRRNSNEFGNEPLNWLASEPTPGSPNGAGVVPPPTVTVAPQSQTILSDTTATLSVQASGGVPLRYQWRFNGIEIQGANARELTLNFVQLENDGAYDVLVSNPAGTALSQPATLVVEAVPIVVNPPLNQAVAPGSTVTFTVGVRASLPISYQWRFNGQAIAGASANSYTFTNAQLGNIGDYSVLISNPVGNALASAYLAVNVPPTYILQPVSQTVVEGDDATFRAAVVGLPPLGYRWRRGGATITNNAIGFATPIFTLTNVSLIHSNVIVDLVASNPVRPAPGGVQSDRVRMFVLPDTDRDRLPDSWETANGFNLNDPADASADADGDGRTNREEYLAGTNPNDPASYLHITLVNAAFNTNPAVLLSFNAASNKTYTVQYRDVLATGGWAKLADIESVTTNRFLEVTDSDPDAASRFYQLITPATR